MEVRDDALAAEVERILESNTFRNSDALRRLLRFLADKRLSGEADQLKPTMADSVHLQYCEQIPR